MTRLSSLVSLLILSLSALAAQAQQGNLFAPRVIVNDRVVSNYEVQQRMMFLQLLNAPGDLEQTAIDGLIEDRLRLDAAKLIGITVDPETVQTGMEEFAGRANLSAEQLIQIIGQRGIAAQTFRDFVEAGIIWREVVRARFGPRVQVTEDEIDRAMALSSGGGARVLLSEIILPADTPARKAASEKLAQRLSDTISTLPAFAAAARRHSVSPSRGRSGRLDWLQLATLPPAISGAVLGLAPGEVSEPLPVPNAIALFQMRALEESDVAEPDTLSVEFARFYLEGDAQTAYARVAYRIDTCDDLYGVAKGLPEARLQRDVMTVADLPADLALELAKLDSGETTLLGGTAPALLMMCGRTPELPEELDRGAIRSRLVNQRMTSYADGYLAELRAEAIIRTP